MASRILGMGDVLSFIEQAKDHIDQQEAQKLAEKLKKGKDFDLESWVAQWMREQLPELGGKTPAEMLRNPEGQRAGEQVLERMRGGSPA